MLPAGPTPPPTHHLTFYATDSIEKFQRLGTSLPRPTPHRSTPPRPRRLNTQVQQLTTSNSRTANLSPCPTCSRPNPTSTPTTTSSATAKPHGTASPTPGPPHPPQHEEGRQARHLPLHHRQSAVGIAKVVSVDATDPKNPIVRIAPVKRLKREKPLAEIREAPVFQGSILFRQFRLSVVPLTEDQYDWLTQP